MIYRNSDTDRKNIAWMKKDNSVATLLQIKLVRGTLRGLHPFRLKLEYPIVAIAGENGAGKSTFIGDCSLCLPQKGNRLYTDRTKKIPITPLAISLSNLTAKRHRKEFT